MAENQSETCVEITIRGIVQGVGFRPFVYREAKKLGIRGTVKNNSGDVEISAAGNAVEAFVENLRHNKPPGSLIESIEVRPAAECINDDFSIIESTEGIRQIDMRFFSPDLALCENCRAEIFDAHNRRLRHYFNTCTNCGPRFSVLKSFPYDRANTSMDVFPMCPDCSAEYHTPADARFHAETICCRHCGPRLLYRRADEIYENDEAFSQAVHDLPGGIAIKGTGAYHLACSPFDSAAVGRLRVLKARESKQFALMFRDLEAIAAVCEFSAEEKALLLSPARPIVLLKMQPEAAAVFADEVLNGAAGRCGCFLPYTPLQELLLQRFPCLVMTSANRSASPVITDEDGIFAFTDRVLYHDREIVRSLEDSVVQVCAGAPSFIRRARGYTPLPVFVNTARNAGNSPALLAMGGDLKSAFGLLKKNVFTLSQYIGDLENADVFHQYENAIPDFERLFAVQPELVICDAHPRYFSSRLAKKITAERNLPLVPVYHHHAHIASVMAEHGLSRVLGVAFDGSGYGEDGNIWGGEFLLCENGQCRRAGHLAYADIIGSDDAARDAAKTAACYLYSRNISLSDIPSSDISPRPVSRAENDSAFRVSDSPLIQAALAARINIFTTSGMGRLFDAVAAILGICQANSYEGQCATLLQYRAEEEEQSGIKPLDMRFDMSISEGLCIFDYSDILYKCLTRRPGAALGFHLAICGMIEQMCLRMREAEGINDIALSGGVFQNAFLLGKVKIKLAAQGFCVYTNNAVPVNDGGLALGQAFLGMRNFSG